MPDLQGRKASVAIRRRGYAASTAALLGRRGARTRDLIKARASDLFIADGYHSTSVDAIAKALGGSRATVYQYFESKEEIYAELVRDCQQAVVEHAHSLGPLGAGEDGLNSLRRWLHEWADIYDDYAAVFLEFPGIGAIESVPVPDASAFIGRFRGIITAKLAAADVEGIDAQDAAAALTRISHMVNLYRYRGMFDLPNRGETSEALAVALQRLLFPEVIPDAVAHRPLPAVTESRRAPLLTAAAPPVAEDVLSVSSALFAERGYYAVGVDDIAAAAGISRATLYRHFSNKSRILAELTSAAVKYTEQLAAELHTVADSDLDSARLYQWMTHYVVFHRRFNGVIRAWFDGAVAEQLADAGVSHGIEALREAAGSVLDRVTLPNGMSKNAACAIFLAILGRMTEPIGTESASDQPHGAAALMVLILQRSLLGSS
ncbi:MAG: hypothetical protein NVSMB60_01380 [Mycobacterium sp.]